MASTFEQRQSVTWQDANARRLERHGFTGPPRFSNPADVASALCGVHAQVMSAAELSIGLRLDHAARHVVREALWVDRTLVKTYGPRGTVHLLPSRDLPMWCGALSALPEPRNAFPEGVRLTPDQLVEVVAAIEQVVADVELTIDELNARVIAATGPWAGDLVMPAFGEMWPRWRQAIHVAASRGALCFGPNHGRKVTYTSPRRVLPGFRLAEPEIALTKLVCRYLTAYGPATPESFARWLSAPARWATDLFESLTGTIEPVTLDGATAWVRAGDTELATQPAPDVLLLPYFDAFVVGGYPRERLFPGHAAERALSNGQAGNVPVLLIDGVVAGVWHQRRTGKWLDITVEPLAELSAGQRRALDEQVERIGEILEGTPRLSIGTVTVRPHA